MINELKQIEFLLSSFLDNPKHEISDSTQLQFSCPRCIDEYGNNEKRKYNLEVNLKKQVFNCWKCSSVHDEMHGSIIKLIKMYGNNSLLSDYKNLIKSLRENKLYSLNYNENDFNINYNNSQKDNLKLPPNCLEIANNISKVPKKVIDYLFNRNIKEDIIFNFNLKYTIFDKNNIQTSNRIIIPSYDKYDELNYWTGRNYDGYQYAQKYFNPNVERKDIIFNENKIDWDSDITLVEGPFDHIVIPNSIPLLGKNLNYDFKIYQEIIKKANAKINIFLDGDAFENVKNIYKLLNHDKFYNRIRYVPINENLDPSKVYELYGNKGILKCLKSAVKINELLLQ